VHIPNVARRGRGILIEALARSAHAQCTSGEADDALDLGKRLPTLAEDRHGKAIDRTRVRHQRGEFP
jgi:hypothetical protein